MVKDLLSLSDRYRSLGPRFVQAFDFAKTTDFAAMPDGTYPMGGAAGSNAVRALVQRYTTKHPDEGRWEAHRAHIDLQFVLTGEEHVRVAPIGRLQAEPYDAEKDILWLTGEGDSVTLRPGEFMLLWPEDAHMPAMAIAAPMPVLKVVIKIAV
ncbi:MAG TPA: YhcH/YjgK/YiaL family protein [Vicinamibacterales bacterium]|nr:YhcH/YjgK/YiaL family protein [Vicinamibacterales bacterium]